MYVLFKLLNKASEVVEAPSFGLFSKFIFHRREDLFVILREFLAHFLNDQLNLHKMRCQRIRNVPIEDSCDWFIGQKINPKGSQILPK